MRTRKLHVYNDGTEKDKLFPDSNENRHLLQNLIIVPDDTGEEAVAVAANDLGKYLQLACRNIKVAVKQGKNISEEEFRGNSLILLGNGDINGLIRKTKRSAKLNYQISYRERYQEITGVPLKDPGAGFSVKTILSPYSKDGIVVMLEGEDKLGIQYAAYDWLEKALGVRFLSPYFEYCPKQKEVRVPLLNFEETCNFPLRRLEVWGYPDASPDSKVHTTFDNHGNDPWLWYKNGLNGDITMMTRCVDWLVKNKQNVITWLPEMFGHWPSNISPEYTRYEAMRGLKIIGYNSAGSQWAVHHYASLYGDISQSMCQSKRGESFDHLCFTQKLFWDVLQQEIAWYERPENKVRQMVAFVLCYEETQCAYPAYCLKDRPAVRCKYCGTIPNWKKWVAAMRNTEKILQAKGWNIPVGKVDFGSGSSGVPWDDDHRFGVQPEWDKKLVDNAPSKNNFFELRPPGDHTCEEMEHYWDFVKKRNRKENLRLSILKEGENILMMSSDLPLISPYYFKSRQHDFDKLSGDSVTFCHDINLYTTRKLEWLKTLYSFRGQWKHEGKWEEFVGNETDHLFGEGVGRNIVAVFQSISRVLEQELVWRKTPWNHDVDSYRGIQTFFPYLTHIFTNCAQHPLDLMEIRRKNGGVWNMAAAGPEEIRLKRRAYRDFVDRDYKTVKKEMLHYLKLLTGAEESLRAGNDRVERNKDLFQTEFSHNIEGAINFLAWRLKAVIAYCLLVKAEKYARKYDKKKTLLAIQEALVYMAESVENIKSYWKDYGTREETIPGSWGNASPSAESVEELYEVWRKLCTAAGANGINWNSALIAYVNENDRYPRLFSNKPSIVGKKSGL
ncbi:MAG: hypothetical protein WC081_04580 [Candidatus Ratteibacteria bacterium]|jgi:hypothetical protein